MTPGRLSRRREFTPVPCHCSTFVYMIPPQNVMPARVTPAWVHPGCCIGARISLRYEISQRYHVNAKRPPTSVWIRSAGGLERVARAYCLRFWIARLLYQHEVYLQITQIWNDPWSCERDTKSISHADMKLAPVRVFSCKHPLRKRYQTYFASRSASYSPAPSARPSPIVHVPTHLRFPYDILC